jgi:hypothetical protein
MTLNWLSDWLSDVASFCSYLEFLTHTVYMLISVCVCHGERVRYTKSWPAAMLTSSHGGG